MPTCGLVTPDLALICLSFFFQVLRNMAAYGVFFSYGRQPVNSWPATPWAMFRTLLTAYIVFDFGFYWMHRMEHLPYFYKWMHKQHREFRLALGSHFFFRLILYLADEFKVTNAAATSWNNASESFAIMVLGNLTALAFKMDLATWLGWVLWSQVMDFQVHVGYVIPYNPANLVSWLNRVGSKWSCPDDFLHCVNRSARL